MTHGPGAVARPAFVFSHVYIGIDLAVVRCMFLRRPWPALVALAGTAACAHASAHRPGDERLAKIDFEGNQRLSDKTLGEGLALKRVQRRGGSPDPYLVQV